MPKQSASTQQFVDIENISNDVIILKNGSLRRVLMVAGINFELKSEEEQNIITYAYQNFLNTLNFSVQFIIHSRKLNIDGYLEKLAGRKKQENNELMKNQISEYIEFIRLFVDQNAIMTKTFFAIVPYDPIQIPTGGKKIFEIFKLKGKTQTTQTERNLEQKIQQLNHRTDQIINGLTQIGLRVVPLNNEELIELFYNLYNPGTTEKGGLKIAKEQ